MNIPNATNLKGQSYKLNVKEFVWVFDNEMFILRIENLKNDTTSVYMEVSKIDKYGNNGSPSHEFFTIIESAEDVDLFLRGINCWSYDEPPPIYKKFEDGKLLVPLVVEVMCD